MDKSLSQQHENIDQKLYNNLALMASSLYDDQPQGISAAVRARPKIILYFDAPIHPARLRCSSVK
jgi:hypothetical protein